MAGTPTQNKFAFVLRIYRITRFVLKMALIRDARERRRIAQRRRARAIVGVDALHARAAHDVAARRRAAAIGIGPTLHAETVGHLAEPFGVRERALEVVGASVALTRSRVADRLVARTVVAERARARRDAMARGHVALLSGVRNAIAIDAACDASMKRGIATRQRRGAVRVVHARDAAARRRVAVQRRELAITIYFAAIFRGNRIAPGSSVRAAVDVAARAASVEIFESELAVARRGDHDEQRRGDRDAAAHHR